MLEALIAIALAACGGAPAVPAPAPAASPPVGDHGVDVANLNAQLPPYLASIGHGEPQRAFSGYVLVAQHDQVLYGHGFGFANRATQRVPTADTSFRVGSVTKQFTAAAILRLEQDGRLSVTDKVSKHLPDYAGPGKDVTIHQLLTHTGGIPSYTANEALMARRDQPITVHDLLATFWDQPLKFPPGSNFEYSNSGYVILGAIIERASGMPYATYLAQRLFRPAGLTHTEVGDARDAVDRAEGYVVRGQDVAAAHPIDMTVPFAAGAVRSTARDLVRWHRALAGETILSAASRDKLYRVERNDYAYGWVVSGAAGHRAVRHNGGIDGFATSYWRIPDADLVVVVWSNLENVQSHRGIGKAAVEVALGRTLETLPAIQAGALDRAVTERLAGTYAMTDDSKSRLAALGAPPRVIDSVATLTITTTSSGIELKPVGQPAIELLPDAGSFYNADINVRIRADASGAEPIQSFTMEQNKVEMTFQRR
jgi:D-alanyl-D-alanine carboxypeptidase